MDPNNPYAPPIAGGGGSDGAGTGKALAGGYEFSELENETIGACGRRTRIWGIIAMVGGVLALIGILVMIVMPMAILLKVMMLAVALPAVIVHLAIARRYMGAGDALIRVTVTQDNDVEHLLMALNDLGVAFKVEVIITLIGLVVGLATAVAGVPVARALGLLSGGG